MPVWQNVNNLIINLVNQNIHKKKHLLISLQNWIVLNVKQLNLNQRPGVIKHSGADH